jgi:P4 family phage/plasmid primase-like protien
MMKNEFEKYKNKNLICFSIDIKQKQNKNGEYKKDIKYPTNWENIKLQDNQFNTKHNGLALLTGKVNNIIVVDIDNLEHWEEFLEKNNSEEPNTVKAISGSGGIHLYFKYSDDLDDIKSTSKCFDPDYDIDIRTNGGNIIAPPTTYYNENLKKQVEYKWEKSIFDCELKKFPTWMKNLLLNKNKKEKEKENKNKDKKKKNLVKCQDKEVIKDITEDMSEVKNIENIEIDDEDKNLNFTISEIESLLDMLNLKRCNNYTDWINVGLCLHNINDKYLLLWEKWSQQSNKYQDGDCDNNWNKFKKDKNGLNIGSLLYWAKNDNPEKYENFIQNKKIGSLVKQKFPNENLIIGERKKLNDKISLCGLLNKECLIKKDIHHDMPNSMHLRFTGNIVTVECRHPECFGKIYPCEHTISLTKNEMIIANNDNVNIYINQQDDDLVEFQQIDIYEDKKLNELVFNSLNGESYPFAKIVHHFYENKFIYAEDENWYIFENHKWKCIGKKNMKLRDLAQEKLKSLYSQLYNYYKENEYDKNKIKSLKQTIKSFDNTLLKNNILTELMEIYSINNNPNEDFVSKLDSNNNLIGFNNGVFDLNTFSFRDGKQDDYITLTVGYNYNENHTAKYNDLLKFLQDIQPNKEERDYMITYLSIGLVGNLLELFTILTGCGRNGKSKLIDLIELTFGDYWGTVSASLFTRKRPDANAPDPGLLSLANKRIITSSEPEKKEFLNSGFIKFLTGKDSTTLRNCHSNEIVKFKPNFITLFICNDIPECDDIDKAFSKRLRCINFPTEFVNEPIKENQKKIDVNINKKFDDWRLDFMLLLIEYYKKYQETHELNPTNNILKWTNQYQEETDIYLQFLNENTEENKDGHIHCSTLYESFKHWFKSNNPNTKIPSNKEFANNLRKYKELKKVFANDKMQLGIKNLRLI